MKVSELIELLEKLDKDSLVVKRATGYSWECYEPLGGRIKEAELFANGSIYEKNKDTEGESTKKVKVIIIS